MNFYKKYPTFFINQRTLIFLAKFLLFLLILLQITTRIINTHIDYDEGFNLQVSLNLNQIKKYATYDRILDPYITTGSTVLIPCLFFINDFNPLLPRIIMLCYTFLLIFICYKKIMKTNTQKLLYLIFLNFTPLFYFFSSHVLGEIPGFALFVISLLLFQKNKYYLSGMFLMLSIFTKSLYMLGIVSILFMLFMDYINIKKITQIRRSIENFLFGSFFIFSLWHFYALSNLQFNLIKYSSVLLDSYMVFQIKSGIALNLIPARLEMITYVFGINAYLFLFTTILLAIVIILKRQFHNTLICAFAIYYLINLIYFIIFSPTNWYRHFFPSVLSLSILTPYFLGYFIFHTTKKSIFIFGLFFTILISSLYLSYISPKSQIIKKRQRIQQNLIFDNKGFFPIFKQDPILKNQLDITEYITKNISKKR